MGVPLIPLQGVTPIMKGFTDPWRAPHPVVCTRRSDAGETAPPTGRKEGTGPPPGGEGATGHPRM